MLLALCCNKTPGNAISVIPCDSWDVNYREFSRKWKKKKMCKTTDFLSGLVPFSLSIFFFLSKNSIAPEPYLRVNLVNNLEGCSISVICGRVILVAINPHCVQQCESHSSPNSEPHIWCICCFLLLLLMMMMRVVGYVIPDVCLSISYLQGRRL